MTRALFVWLHRWAGLTMAAFLIVVGLTGSLLAFYWELDRWLAPQYHLDIRAGALLDAATLLQIAESRAPQARAKGIKFLLGDVAIVRMETRPDATKPIDFHQLILNPVTGEEVARRVIRPFPDSLSTLMPFIYKLHYTLAMNPIGNWVLGVVALVWTIDCFIGAYLTLPLSGASRKSFWARWKPSWQIKLRASFYRINFDLHRAFGLWLWIMLLVFAWSSVYMNLNNFYTPTTQLFLDLEQTFWFREPEQSNSRSRAPMSWAAAQAAANKIVDDQSARHGFTLDRPTYLGLDRENNLYEYRIHSSRDVGDRYGQTFFWFDAVTGELRSMILPTGHRAGNTLTTWLIDLHTANIFGLPYRVFVCLLGLAITMLSVTGVYIWLKKRRARLAHERRAVAQPAPAE